MTPAEKRYFKMHFALQRNALTILYDFLNEMEEYDEKELKKKLPKNIANKLKVYKIRLYERVLKSLTTFYAKKNIQSKIRLGLEEVDVLMAKKLYDVAADHLYKLKKVAEEYEEFTYLIDIAYLEFRLLNIFMDRIGISKQPLFADMGYYLEKLDQQIHFSQLAHQTIDFQKTNYYKELQPPQKEWLTTLLEEKIPELTGSEASFKASISRNIILTVIYQFLKEKKLEFKTRKKNVELFNQFPQFKESLTFHYLAVLRNYMNYCLNHKKFDEVRRVVAEAKQFIQKQTPHEEPQLIYFYYAELKMLYEKGQFKTIAEDYSQMIERFTKKNHIVGERISVISFVYIILAELFESHHSKAQYFLRLINKADEEVKEYFEEFFILLDLVSHYEAGDTHSLNRQLRKLKRKYSIPEQPDTFFLSMINWIDRLNKYPEQKAIIAMEMKSECKQKFAGDKNMDSFRHYHLDSWCGALIDGTSLKKQILQYVTKKSPSYNY
jgi:hypothetical protein